MSMGHSYKNVTAKDGSTIQGIWGLLDAPGGNLFKNFRLKCHMRETLE